MAKGLQKPDLGKFDEQIAKLQAEYDENMKNAMLAEQHKKVIEAEVDMASADMSAGKEGADAASEDAKARVSMKLDQINAFITKAKQAESQMRDAQDAKDKAEAEGMTWIVGPGDSLSKIAKEVYGDAHKYMKIFEANKGKIKDPNIIVDGWELKIPAA